MSGETSELHNEFELERVILFSDAVFAIAITLLIIEIKFPEVPKGATGMEVLSLFKPAIIRFVGFALSFFFVGLLWSRHLEMFKYLKTYDRGLIFHNLLFLFFIVCFPFTASGLTEFIRPSFLLPVYIYLVNLAFVSLSQYALCNYMFKKKIHLTKHGYDDNKRYILLRSKYTAIAFTATVSAIVLLSIIFPSGSIFALTGIYILPLILVIMRKRLQKNRLAAE